MAKILGSCCLGRRAEFIAALPHPDRTAYRCGPGAFDDDVFQEWPNRASMARSIRMQERRSASPRDWRPVVKLTDGEGY